MNESPRGSGSGGFATVARNSGTPVGGAGAMPSASGIVIGADAAFIGVGCIAVATAELLGVDGLREQLLGIPAGLWIIAGGYGLMRIIRAARSAGQAGASSVVEPAAGQQPEASESDQDVGAATNGDAGQLRLSFAGSSGETGTLPKLTFGGAGNSGCALLRQSNYRLADVDAPMPAGPGPAGRMVLGAAGAALVLAPGRASRTSRFSELLSRWHDGASWPTRPLRIGMDLHSDLAAMLIRAGAGLGLEWVPLPAGTDDSRACAARALDGVVRMDAVGDIRLTTAEHPAREAGWYDWSRQMPLSYSAVFPTRIDPCIVTLSRGWGFEAPDARLIARLIQAAAILSRSTIRLGFRDRLRGRRPIDLGGAWGAGAMPVCNGRVVAAVSNLTECVCTMPTADAVALKAAARVVGAWASTTDEAIDPEVRREAAEASLRVLEGEPEAVLRAVATRFATYDDEAAFAGLVEADRMIRAAGVGPILDPVAFLEAEIELGLPGPMTFGRVAAGLGLVCATIEDARLDYVCDDLVEEMRYSGWLIGRDADRRVLVEVLRTLQRARRGTPVREAA